MRKKTLVYLLFLLCFLVCYFVNSLVVDDKKDRYRNVISINEDIIGDITISNALEKRALLQGLDNNYYLKHDLNREDNKNGEVFLDYQGDLLNNNYPYIYLNTSLLKEDIKVNDVIKVNYLGNKLSYIVKRIINNNIKSEDLVIKVVENNNVIKSIECIKNN